MECELREVMSGADLEAAKSVRLEVFVREQGVPSEIEMDEYDSGAIHVLCLVNGKPVGTGRLVKMPDGMKLGRVAVLRDFRGKGLGREIVEWLLRRAGDYMPIYANVQLAAAGFYRKLGFAPEGKHFTEADIEHVRMARRT